jgi:DNA-binding GntR family transcriptional regulator
MSAKDGFSTAQEMALDYLRRAIAAGTLKPGQRIQQDNLAAELGVSRMPIREAFRQLEAEGLVTVYPHRGVVVTDVSIKDIEDIYVIRIALEGAAANLGARKISDDGIQKLVGLLDEMENLGYPFNPSAWLSLNEAFHSTIYQAADCPRLYKLITNTSLTISPYIRTHIMTAGSLEAINKGHHTIFEAVKARNGAKTEELTKHHLRETADAVASYLTRLAS